MLWGVIPWPFLLLLVLMKCCLAPDYEKLVTLWWLWGFISEPCCWLRILRMGAAILLVGFLVPRCKVHRGCYWGHCSLTPLTNCWQGWKFSEPWDHDGLLAAITKSWCWRHYLLPFLRCFCSVYMLPWAFPADALQDNDEVLGARWILMQIAGINDEWG